MSNISLSLVGGLVKFKKDNDDNKVELLPKEKFSFSIDDGKVVCPLYGPEAVAVEDIEIEGEIPSDISDFYIKLATVFPDAGGSANNLNDTDIYALLGSQIKAEPIGLSAANISNSTALVDGTLYIIGMALKKKATLTGLKFFVGTQGAYTADNYNGIGLYTYESGVITLVASSTNDGNIWKATGNAWTSKAFSSALANADPGVYFIGLLYNSSAQTMAPSVAQCTSMSGGTNGLLVDFTNSVKVFGSLAAQASLPVSANMSSFTSEPTKRIYVGLY